MPLLFLVLDDDEDVIRIRRHQDLVLLAADPQVVELVGGVHLLRVSRLFQDRFMEALST